MLLFSKYSLLKLNKVINIFTIDKEKTITFLTFYNIICFLLIWSLIKTMISDPGRVPLYWGFFLNDPESKKLRYCLICHIFKVKFIINLARERSSLLNL